MERLRFREIWIDREGASHTQTGGGERKEAHARREISKGLPMHLPSHSVNTSEKEASVEI